MFAGASLSVCVDDFLRLLTFILLSYLPHFSHAQAIKKYRRRFQDGVELYIRGNWEDAANIFHKCQIELPQDKPPKVLLKHLARFNNHSPQDWPGFRELKEK